MASALVTSLTTARDALAARLAEIAAATAPKLTYTENGRTFSWTEYQIFLTDKIEALDRQIANHSPFTIRSRAR